MNKRLLLACAALMALTAPLAACDDDQPQTPEIESSATSTDAVNDIADRATPQSDLPEVIPPPVLPTNLAEVDNSTSTLPAPGTEVAPPATGEAVLPEDIAEENIPPPPSREEFTDESCAYDAWIGTKLDEELVKAEGRPYRIVKPGDAVTMDHNPDRINVEHSDGTVMRVWCG